MLLRYPDEKILKLAIFDFGDAESMARNELGFVSDPYEYVQRLVLAAARGHECDAELFEAVEQRPEAHWQLAVRARSWRRMV